MEFLDEKINTNIVCKILLPPRLLLHSLGWHWIVTARMSGIYAHSFVVGEVRWFPLSSSDPFPDSSNSSQGLAMGQIKYLQ